MAHDSDRWRADAGKPWRLDRQAKAARRPRRRWTPSARRWRRGWTRRCGRGPSPGYMVEIGDALAVYAGGVPRSPTWGDWRGVMGAVVGHLPHHGRPDRTTAPAMPLANGALPTWWPVSGRRPWPGGGRRRAGTMTNVMAALRSTPSIASNDSKPCGPSRPLAGYRTGVR